MWKCLLALLEPFVEHLCQKNPGIVRGRTKRRLCVCWWAPSDRAFAHRVQPGSAQKQGFGDAVAEFSLCPSSVKGGGDDKKQILALSSLDDHQESKSLLPRLILMVGWLHILGTLEIWSETNEAVPNHHGAFAGLCDRLDCCIVSSASDTAITLEGQGWTYTRPAHSLQRKGAFLWFGSKITVVFKRCRAFWCRCAEFFLNHTCWDSPVFTSRQRPELNYWGCLFHH